MATQKQIGEQLLQIQRVTNAGIVCVNESPMKDDDKEEDISKSAFELFRAMEEEIERKKMEMRDMVHARLGRVEDETRRLADIRQELEGLVDPMRKDVAIVRKKIDTVNRELKPLGFSCQKKEKEYNEALEAYNQKNTEKKQLVSKLLELVSESERLRMKKLEELSKSMEMLHK